MLELLLFEHAVNFREVDATFCLILHQVTFLCGSWYVTVNCLLHK